MRKEPNGEIVGEMKDGTYVWVWPGEKQGNWYPVLQNNLQGYTHKQNLIKYFNPCFPLFQGVGNVYAKAKPPYKISGALSFYPHTKGNFYGFSLYFA